MDSEVTSLSTLQFAVGGLVDATTDCVVHLVRATRSGTPGPTLCGIDRFAPTTPGWSIRGGVDAPTMTHTPCGRCVKKAARDYADLPVHGMPRLADAIRAALPAAIERVRRDAVFAIYAQTTKSGRVVFCGPTREEVAVNAPVTNTGRKPIFPDRAAAQRAAADIEAITGNPTASYPCPRSTRRGHHHIGPDHARHRR